MIPAAVTAGAEMDFSIQKCRLMALQTLEEASTWGGGGAFVMFFSELNSVAAFKSDFYHMIISTSLS